MEQPIRHAIAIAALLLFTACEGHETPGSADDPAPAPHIGDRPRVDRATGEPLLARTAEQIVSAQITAAVLDWRHQVIGPDDVDDQGLGVYVVTFPSGALLEESPGHLVFSGHGLEGLDTETPVSFVDSPNVTRGEMPGPFGGSVRLYYGTLDGTLDLAPAVAAELVKDTQREPLTTQLLIRVLGASSAGDVDVTACELLGVRVLATSRGEILLEGRPATKLRS